MGADGLAQSAGRLPAVAKRTVAALSAERRRFWIGLTCAALLHASIIFVISRSASSPRHLGEKEGRPDGISVVLVDAADLESRDTVPQPAEPPPGSQSAAQPSKPSQASPPAPPPLPKEAMVREIERSKPDPLTLPDLPGKESPPTPPTPAAKSQPKPQPKAKPQPESPMQLSMPDMAFPQVGRSAAVARPPGYTRSGENDDFARGVIRALRQTMPAPNGTLGRVTVKIVLTDNGNLQEVAVVRPGDDPNMTQNVVFAVKQASFPFPPAGSPAVDRVFLVTYIYR